MVPPHLLAIATAFLLTGDAQPPSEETSLGAALEALRTDEAIAALDLEAAVGCSDGTGVIATLPEARPLNPASGTKLLTTAVALATLGPEHRFITSIHGAPPVDGVVHGPLVIVPSGDPSLQGAALVDLARAIAATGVTRVLGRVEIALGHFAGDDLPPAFAQKRTDAAYRPSVPPFGDHDGAIAVTVRPGKKVGAAVSVSTRPAGEGVLIENTARTAAGKGIGALTVATAAGPGGATRVLVGGELGVKAAPQGVRRRLHDPAVIARASLATALKRAGITIEGGVHLRREPLKELPPRLGTLEGPPLRDLVTEINVHSNNYQAEGLFRLLGDASSGAPLSWEAAQERVGERLKALFDIPTSQFRIVNGSGLYDGTLITAEGLVRILRAHPPETAAGASFRESLAVAGTSGTLKRRLKTLGPRLRAKTGTLDGALSLAGYLERARGCELAFAVIVNGPIGKRAGKVRGAIDAWVTGLAER